MGNQTVGNQGSVGSSAEHAARTETVAAAMGVETMLKPDWAELTHTMQVDGQARAAGGEKYTQPL